jgi:hypothetical protein
MAMGRPRALKISLAFRNSSPDCRVLGLRFYMQEYLCSFCDVVDAVFAYSDIQAALSDDVKPLFPGLIA